MLATLLLSQGTPMLLAGDELGRTQRGNNNAYCQDNEISWVDWNVGEQERTLLAFVERMIRLRHRHPVFRRRDFFQGRPIHGSDAKDVLWLTADGREMSDEEWNQHNARALGVFLSGEALTETDRRGQPLRDEDFLILFNAHHEAVPFRLPQLDAATRWLVLLDTALEGGLARDGAYDAGAEYPLQGRALALLQRQRPGG